MPQDAHTKRIIENTSIGFEFDFIMYETNATSSGKLEFDRPSLAGTDGFMLDFTASASKTRKTTRTFRLLDSLADIDKADCSPEYTRANRAYPITGATGIAEVVRTYIRVERLTDLVRDDAGTVFSDKLEFETKLSAGVTPHLEVKSVAGRFKLTNFSLTGSATRDDTHNVAVALCRSTDDVDPPRGTARGMRAMRASRAKTTRESWRNNVNVVTTRTMSKVVEVDSEASNRILLELQRIRNNREDAKVVSRILFGPSP